MFKVGDVVMLKSGSPLLTVVGFAPPNVNGPVLICRFWNGGKFEQFNDFPEAAVTLAKDATAQAAVVLDATLQ